MITQEAVLEDVLSKIRNTGINPMTDITKLQDKWRDEAKGYVVDSSTWKAYHYCAIELQTNLPKWTKITFNPETWPEGKQFVIVRTKKGDLYSLVSLQSHLGRAYTKGHQNRYTHWRPLCDIDQPPEDM